MSARHRAPANSRQPKDGSFPSVCQQAAFPRAVGKTTSVYVQLHNETDTRLGPPKAQSSIWQWCVGKAQLYSALIYPFTAVHKTNAVSRLAKESFRMLNVKYWISLIDFFFLNSIKQERVAVLLH